MPTDVGVVRGYFELGTRSSFVLKQLLLNCHSHTAYLYYSVWSGITCRWLRGCSHVWTTAGHYTIDHRPQLTWQWNKCVKHCLEWDSSLPLTYPALGSGLYMYQLVNDERTMKNKLQATAGNW